MPYVETLFSHEVLLQPIPPSPQLQVVKGESSHSRHCRSIRVPLLILKPVEDEIRLRLAWLSVRVAQLYRTNIPRSQRPVNYPRGRAVPRVDYFCDTVVQPVLNLFYALRGSPSWPPIAYNKSSSNDCSLITFRRPQIDTTIITIPAEESSTLPAIVILSPTVLRGVISSDPYFISQVSDLLEDVWKSDPDTCVIGCDFENAITMRLELESGTQKIICSHMPISDLIPARILLACFLLFPLLAMGYVYWTWDGDRDDMEGIGPLPHPSSVPILPDSVIFAQYCRHSDFDYPLIYQSEEHGNQFLRWKEHMLTVVKSHFARSGDVLLGMTNRFAQLNPLLRPYYPAVLPPKSTMETFEKDRRSDPLCQFSLRLSRSSSFTIRILRELTESPDPAQTRPCRTYVCQLLSTDNRSLPHYAPLLCLKLFDDRFYPLVYYSQSWCTAEDLVRREIAVYTKLDFMQGSLIPYFYGAHLFTMSSGPPLYGILMEYIDMPTVSTERIKSLSEDEQLQLIRSARDGIRIFQYADISQHDWHRGQILIYRTANGDNKPSVHCVFIDFASCTQSTAAWEEHTRDDILNSAYSLIGPDDVLSPELVARVYGRRELWDRWSSSLEYEDSHYRPVKPFYALFGLKEDPY
ncbi:hypothetical protein QCA50_008196 [Cerrena zonata]|uniref:Protein kinase domain-containing protein n=1 Tax=Cerrena zonata TaxID=2478898 RepID=A0AAW0G4Q1_9APHY